jgi:uncharacterized protein (DUF488 family)
MKIFTIGYGGRKPDEFVTLSKKHDIKIIVDAGLMPQRAFMGVYAKSKDPHKGIQSLLEKGGIQYIWIAELGNMFKGDDGWQEKYRRYLEEKGEVICSQLYELTTPFCLMCCEKLHQFVIARLSLITWPAEVMKEHLE